MTIPSLIILLTVLLLVCGVLWHDETAEGLRQTNTEDPGET
jgi:hypothetical protein